MQPAKEKSPPIDLACTKEQKTMVIKIYSKPSCTYCVKAKNLLELKGLQYTEVNIADSDDLRKEMLSISGGATSVPQIVINGKYIGGFSDLDALSRSGELDKAAEECRA